MPVARHVVGPESTFAGVVAGGLRLDYIVRLFQQVELGVDDTITLILARDSTVAARWPEQPDTIGFVADAPSFSGDGVQSIRGQSKADGQDRLWVTSQIGAYPLRVTVEVSTPPLFSAWYWRVVAIGLVLVFVSVLVAVLVFWLIRELTRRTSSEASLDAALDNMSQGLTFFDRE